MFILIVFCLLLIPTGLNSFDVITHTEQHQQQQQQQQQQILNDFDNLLENNVDKNGLFDQIGSIDVGIYKRLKNNSNVIPVYVKSFGKSQVKTIKEELATSTGQKPMQYLEETAKKHFPSTPDLSSLNSNDVRNQYRIASNTKTFIGVAANLFVQKYGLNLDEKIHPNYVNLSTLGHEHKWNQPTLENGYIKDFPDSSKYISEIAFRHLLTHTSGFSRESQKGSMYAYGSSRTSTPNCPPKDIYTGELICDQSRDSNWKPWTHHIISYMMPACGYQNYRQKSLNQTSCMPGQYFHYSNVGYSILGLALDNYLKRINKNFTIERWIKDNIFKRFQMNDTVFTWVDYDQVQKERTAHGCYGGEILESCNQTRALTDYADRGLKTPPGGIWSTVNDLAQYIINVQDFKNLTSAFSIDQNLSPSIDTQSEEDATQKPSTMFKYGHGWYIAEQFSCLRNKYKIPLRGAWGTVPGFTSYMITNTNVNESQTQYALVLLRSYNYAGRFNLGNQARKLLWRLLHPAVNIAQMECPVMVKDNFSKGDKILGEEKHSSSSIQVQISYLYVSVMIVALSYFACI